MLIGVLALQGAVSEHCTALDSLNVNNKEVRNTEDIRNIDGLIMPGGESTTLRRLLVNANLWDLIIESDMPIMGTCAGAILLGKSDDVTFEKMDYVIDRNFYGRQIDSFEEKLEIENRIYLQLRFSSRRRIIEKYSIYVKVSNKNRKSIKTIFLILIL